MDFHLFFKCYLSKMQYSLKHIYLLFLPLNLLHRSGHISQNKIQNYRRWTNFPLFLLTGCALVFSPTNQRIEVHGFFHLFLLFYFSFLPSPTQECYPVEPGPRPGTRSTAQSSSVWAPPSAAHAAEEWARPPWHLLLTDSTALARHNLRWHLVKSRGFCKSLAVQQCSCH